MTFFDPENWLTSTIECLKDYVSDALNQLVLDDAQNPVGVYDPVTNPNGIYEISMEFPVDLGVRSKVHLPRTIIHFEFDVIEDLPVGIGRVIGDNNYDSASQTVIDQEAVKHMLDIDVGIWTSDKAGGTTARARAYERLSTLFNGALAQEAIDLATNGGNGRLEILRYSGGRFITETISDVVTYRMVDGTLELRVFSRTPLPAIQAPSIEEIAQTPGLSITT